MLTRAEEGLQIRSAHVGLPGEATTVVVGKVELLEHLAAVQDLITRSPTTKPNHQQNRERPNGPFIGGGGGAHLWGEVALGGGLGWPEAGGEDVDAEVDAVEDVAVGLLEVGLEGLHGVGGELHVGEHALELGCELVAALGLELGDHVALGVVGHGAAQQETLRQVLLVVLLEDVLLLDEAEEHHHLVEDGLHLFFAHSLQPLAQLLVDEQGDELGRLVVRVDEMLEGLVDRVLEVLVVGERACIPTITTIQRSATSLGGWTGGREEGRERTGKEAVVLVLEVEEGLDVELRVLVLLLVGD